MRGSRFCFDLLETKSQNNIRLPLVSLTHYKGFVVVATALLPLIQGLFALFCSFAVIPLPPACTGGRSALTLLASACHTTDNPRKSDCLLNLFSFTSCFSPKLFSNSFALEASKPAQNILDVVKSVGASLNLAPFSPTQEGPAVYGPELSLSTAVDNRTYYMDLSTFMPPGTNSACPFWARVFLTHASFHGATSFPFALFSCFPLEPHQNIL